MGIENIKTLLSAAKTTFSRENANISLPAVVLFSDSRAIIPDINVVIEELVDLRCDILNKLEPTPEEKNATDLDALLLNDDVMKNTVMDGNFIDYIEYTSAKAARGARERWNYRITPKGKRLRSKTIEFFTP